MQERLEAWETACAEGMLERKRWRAMLAEKEASASRGLYGEACGHRWNNMAYEEWTQEKEEE